MALDAPKSIHISVSSEHSEVKWSMQGGHVNKTPLVSVKNGQLLRPNSMQGSLDVQFNRIASLNFDSGHSNRAGGSPSSSKSVLENVRAELLKAI